MEDERRCHGDLNGRSEEGKERAEEQPVQRLENVERPSRQGLVRRPPGPGSQGQRLTQEGGQAVARGTVDEDASRDDHENQKLGWRDQQEDPRVTPSAAVRGPCKGDVRRNPTKERERDRQKRDLAHEPSTRSRG
jgi:hypothetical protein